MALIRYPGGKNKLRCQIMAAIHEQVDHTEVNRYLEPFFGGGGIGICVRREISQFQNFHLNDKDVALACYWTAIIRYPDALIQMI